ncbi:MAG: UDP-galactopyranose mutase [Prevotellaceae bacterium]|jgi:UDP-galactopyranose mutase|nr:UDP-galactopyranose mutase [Prevotellaceae bacterium]
MTKHTEYDYVIVGSGLFGAVFAHQAGLANKKCMVVERRPHVGGNVYTENISGINVHKYGAHIFHTGDREVWNYVNGLNDFIPYNHYVMANYRGEVYNLPFNMNTFYRLWGTKTPDEAQKILANQISEYADTEPSNLEEQALKLAGKDIYEKLIKGYTEKQWGRKASELPTFIIKRLPLRYTFSNNYYNDRYTGIPSGGYTRMIEKMIARADVVTDVNFNNNRKMYENIAKNIVYTGMIDEYFDYCYGALEYRSLRFETELLDTDNFQGCAVMNYTDFETPYTRIIEHKHFELGSVQPQTVITREYPEKLDKSKEAYYPVNDERNNRLFERYRQKALSLKNVIFGGRLADYAYYDMDKVIRNALDISRTLIFDKL